jgi:hypothetical protein
MDKNEAAKTRRMQLAVWFEAHSIPESEKSYISQLLNGKTSFGEKAARRLERDYGMGEGYLDARQPDSQALEEMCAIYDLLDDSLRKVALEQMRALLKLNK